MSCSQCNSAVAELTEVHESSWEEQQCLSWKSFLCGNCLVGKAIPVLRSSTGKWQMAHVEAYEWDTQKHHVAFGFGDEEGLREWVQVPSNPFHDYVSNSAMEDSRDDKSAAATEEKDFADEDFSLADCSPLRIQKFLDSEDDLLFPDGEFAFDRDLLKESDSHTAELADEIHDHLEETFKDTWLPMDTALDLATDCQLTPKDVGNEKEEPSTKEDPSKSPGEKRNEVATKSGPRLWSPKEDRMLLDSIEAVSNSAGVKKPFLWPEICKHIPGRTGKQCRERYVNHLQPTIRLNIGWSPKEDALIWHYYYALGKKWASIARLLPGRSDNAVKNRFHFTRRKLEKMLAMSSIASISQQKWFEPGNNIDKLELGRAALDSLLALRMEQKMASLSLSKSPKQEQELEYAFQFEPLDVHAKAEGTVCKRCALTVPSRQTGATVCKQTGWCEACTKAPPFVHGTNLRKLHDAGCLDPKHESVFNKEGVAIKKEG